MAEATISLSDKVIAVVGGNGGLGAPIAGKLSERGATVLSASRTSEIKLDLRDATAGDTLVAAALKRHGRLDGVIVAAGVVGFGPVVEAEDAIVEELFLLNAIGPFWLAKRVIPELARSKGFLLNISAVVAEQPMPNMTAYSASKAAAAAMVTALRSELRRQQVRVIDVRPPHTETGLANRPIAGTAPAMKPGLDPETVAERIVAAIESNEREVPSTAF